MPRKIDTNCATRALVAGFVIDLLNVLMAYNFSQNSFVKLHEIDFYVPTISLDFVGL